MSYPSSFTVDPRDAKAQLDFDRARQRKAAQRSHSNSLSSSSASKVSSSSSPSSKKPSWRRPSASDANSGRGHRKDNARTPTASARSLWYTDEHDHPYEHDEDDVPDTTSESASETEHESGTEDMLLRDLIAPHTDALDFINVSEYYLARSVAYDVYYAGSSSRTGPLQDRDIGPGLGLPGDATRWIMSEEEHGFKSECPSSNGLAPNTFIVVQDTIW